ncbi:MAG TPA: acetyl-CoA carboxylase biotin carboxyl carrier protein [Planctomycetota bacterium]|nr:acetyl-CoA carboxylase biotin carboxyl carrier protein [Planctomycetota bacterium]
MATKRPTKAQNTRAESVASRPKSAPEPGAVPAEDPRVSQIQRLIDLMVQKGAVEVELEEKGTKLRVRLKEDRPAPGIVHYGAPQHAAAPPPVPHQNQPSPTVDPTAEGDVFLSPMVGTFYRAPSPDAEPFVQVGDMVAADGSLCIIEAMKVMNEIKAEFPAQVTAILVENGTPVEFGQPLFRLKRM